MTDFLADLQAHFADRYTIERELGGGGMSRVVLARDPKLDRRVVIKLLPPSVTATLSAERFKREIMLAAGLQHPNIVPVLSAGDFGPLPYFIMPFIEGESLRARMRRGPVSVRECVTILKDVTRALAFAHGRGIIHRDIKPDNVLLAAGAAVVTDFGVAKAISASRQSGFQAAAGTMTGVGTSLGTPAYMAPEQAAADPATDHRADLYALGIVAYEMLTGAPPFHGRTPQALLAAQLSEKPAPLTSRRYDVSMPLSTLIMQCLEKEPAKRPKTANDVLRALARVPGVRVASQTTAAAVRQGVQSPADAARALNVTYLLEGTVQRARERLRVSVRLVSVGNDSTVWAGTFDGTTADALALQDSTVRAVAGAVAATAGTAPR